MNGSTRQPERSTTLTRTTHRTPPPHHHRRTYDLYVTATVRSTESSFRGRVAHAAQVAWVGAQSSSLVSAQTAVPAGLPHLSSMLMHASPHGLPVVHTYDENKTVLSSA